MAVSEKHIFRRTINQFTGGFNRIFNHILSFGTGPARRRRSAFRAQSRQCCLTGYPRSLNQSTKGLRRLRPEFNSSDGYWSVGDRGFSPFQGGTNVFFDSDTLEMIRGKHNIRFGGGIRANQMNVLTNGFQRRVLPLFGVRDPTRRDDAADLLLGQVGGSIHDQTFLGATTGRRWKMFRPYVQDDWRVSDNLTLNLGVAWSLSTPITEAQNRQANFNYATGQF